MVLVVGGNGDDADTRGGTQDQLSVVFIDNRLDVDDGKMYVRPPLDNTTDSR